MTFPDTFWWGTAASSNQCEGAAPASDWARWERTGRAPPSGDGNGFAHRYEEDFALLEHVVELGEHVLHALHVLGRDVLHALGDLVEHLIGELLAQLLHQLFELLARLGGRELVFLQRAHLAGQVGR